MVMQASCHVHYVGTFYCVLEFTSYGDVSTLWRIKVSHEMTRLPYKCRNRKDRFNLQRQGFLCKIALKLKNPNGMWAVGLFEPFQSTTWLETFSRGCDGEQRAYEEWRRRGDTEKKEKKNEVRKFLEWEAWQEAIYFSCSIKKKKKNFLAHPSHSLDFLHFLPLFSISLCIIDELD